MTDTDTTAIYRERAHLIALVATLYPSHIGYTDPNEPDYAVITIDIPTGQLTWHISRDDIDLFEHVPVTLSTDAPWDGHTTDEKYERIRKHAARAPQALLDHLVEHCMHQRTDCVAAADLRNLLLQAVNAAREALSEADRLRDQLDAIAALEVHGREFVDAAELYKILDRPIPDPIDHAANLRARNPYT